MPVLESIRAARGEDLSAITDRIVFDDIRLWNMLRIWHGIRRPKLDMVSFGHWSGTGWFDWDAASEAG